MGLDCYAILGISKGAGESEIKSAYRKQAIRFHPDKDPSEEAAKKFTEVAKAYEVLKDSQTRAEYDRLGSDAYWNKDNPSATNQSTQTTQQGASGTTQTSPGAGFSTVDALRNFMRAFTGEDVFANKGEPNKGQDISITFPLTIDDIILGPEKTIRIHRLSTCPTCRGQGAVYGDQIQCPTCAGQKKVRDASGNIISCPTCGATGIHFSHPCEMCQGKGINKIRDKVKFKIPAGAGEGNFLRIQEKGQRGFRNSGVGDLIITFSEKLDADLERKGADVVRTLSVDLYTMVLGGKASFKTLRHQRKMVKIPSNSKNGSFVSVANEGFPKYKKTGVGSLYLKLQVELPTSLTTNEKELFAKLQGIYKKKHESTYVKVGRYGLIRLKPSEDPVHLAGDLIDLAEILSSSGLTPAVDLTEFTKSLNSELISALVKIHRTRIGKGKMNLVSMNPSVEESLERMAVSDLFRVTDMFDPEEIDDEQVSSSGGNTGDCKTIDSWKVCSLGSGILNGDVLAEDSKLQSIFEDIQEEKIAFDFRSVVSIDSTIISKLIKAYKATSPKGQVALIGPTARVVDVLEETAVLGLFKIVKDESDLVSK